MKNQEDKWLYLNNQDDTVRYILGEKGEKMVACIGINPSTARPNNLDNTIKSVKRISEFNGFDGWIMYNVYPQRATNPNDLPKQIDHEIRLKNIGVLRQSIKHLGIDTIWIGYGDLIEKRNYLRYCMADLYSKLSDIDLKWKIIGNPTKKGHPRHPLYKSTASTFLDFDIQRYTTEKLNSYTKEFEKTYINGIEFK